MTPYVFFLDIDDTILYKKDKSDPGTVSPRVINTMKAVRELGHKVFINTGRAPSYFTDTIRSFPVDGYVCGCGSYLLENGKVLYQAQYPNHAILKWMERLSNPDDPGIIVEGIEKIFRYRNCYWLGDSDWIVSDSTEDFKEYLKHDSIVKASICNDIPPKLFAEILPEKEQDFLVIHHPTEHYTECCIKGCSKATGMKMIMDHLGLDMSRSIAIGDSENDLDMIKAAGIGVVMGQARDEIKQFADRICDDIHHDGAAKIMEEFAGILI